MGIGAICFTLTRAKERHEILETAGFLFLFLQEVEFLLESEWLIQFRFVVFPLSVYLYVRSRVVSALLCCWFADRGRF
jgi:hypothetical protein